MSKKTPHKKNSHRKKKNSDEDSNKRNTKEIIGGVVGSISNPGEQQANKKRRKKSKRKGDTATRLYASPFILVSHLLVAAIAIFSYSRFVVPSTNPNVTIGSGNTETVSITFHQNGQNLVLRDEEEIGFSTEEHEVKLNDSAPIVDDDVFSQFLLSTASEDKQETTSCTFYLARSTIPNGGLGLFTTRSFAKGEVISPPNEIIIQVPDLNPVFTSGIDLLLYDYIWDGSTTGGQYEGKRTYSVLPGFGMLANGHDVVFNTEMDGENIHFDTVGLNRGRDPGAGSNSQYLNPSFVATTAIPEGGEILMKYGKEWFQERREKKRMHEEEDEQQKFKMNNLGSTRFKRSVAWIQKQGICLDNLKVGQSTIQEAGRGAFAARKLQKDEIIAPMPVVQITDRRSLDVIKIRENENGEEVIDRTQQLLLNYCIGHANSSLLLYPYVSKYCMLAPLGG